MRIAWIVAASLGCRAPAPPPEGPPVARAVRPVPDAAPPAEPIAEDEPAVDSQREESTLTGPRGLRVRVAWQTMTGTTHVAEELELSDPAGTLRFVADAEAAPASPPLPDVNDLPLVDRIHGLTGDRWLILGWSSHGEGLQTVHAWLVDDEGHGPHLVDAIAWTTARSHAGFAIDLPRARIGVPLPSGRDLHGEPDWSLALERGARTLSLADVARLPAASIAIAELADYYTPPFHAEPASRGWSGRIVWLATRGRFTPAK